MAIIKLNNNALTSVTELPSGVGADPNVKVDLARLGLRVFANQNLASTSSNSIFYDVFQDSSGISANTNAPRNTGEFISTISSSSNLFVPEIQRISNYSGGVNTPSWGEQATNSTIANHAKQGNSVYGGCVVNELWDLANDFTCKMFVTNGDNSGSLSGAQYMACGMIISDDTSISAGSDPNIFDSLSNTQWFGTSHTSYTDWLNSTAESAFGVSSFNTNYSDEGNSNYSYNLSGISDAHVSHYYNDGGNDEAGFVVQNVSSTNTITITAVDGSNNLRPSAGKITVTNVPSSGRAVIGFGNAATNNSRYWSTSFASGVTANGDHSSKTTTTANASGNFTSSTITAPSSVNKLSAVITYKDNAGTNSLNTDLVLQMSADNGSNFSTATLTALPDFATGVKCCKVTDLSVTAGTQIKYKISFANQALASKECRITGVSLQF